MIDSDWKPLDPSEWKKEPFRERLIKSAEQALEHAKGNIELKSETIVKKEKKL